MHASEELFLGAWLNDEVIRAALETPHAIVHACRRTEHEDERAHAALTHGSTNGEAVDLGERRVQDEEIVGARAAQAKGFRARPAFVDEVSSVAESLCQEVANPLVVLRDERFHHDGLIRETAASSNAYADPSLVRWQSVRGYDPWRNR